MASRMVNAVRPVVAGWFTAGRRDNAASFIVTVFLSRNGVLDVARASSRLPHYDWETHLSNGQWAGADAGCSGTGQLSPGLPPLWGEQPGRTPYQNFCPNLSPNCIGLMGYTWALSKQ